MEQEEFRSSDALCVLDRQLVVRTWNAAAERLTCIPAAHAVGRHCWEVLGGVSETGEVVCHPGCVWARLAREGRPPSCRALLVRGRTTRERVRVSTVALADGRIVHLLLRDRRDRGPALPRRRRQVLGLLADGLPAKVIALRLGVSEATIRTHIRGLLRDLGAHSQLEAVAKARRLGILG